ncbi:MAG: hypothetical protein WCP66_04620 [Methylococcales bacterium]
MQFSLSTINRGKDDLVAVNYEVFIFLMVIFNMKLGVCNYWLFVNDIGAGDRGLK